MFHNGCFSLEKKGVDELTLELAIGSRSTTVAVSRPDNKQNHCKTGEECE